MARLLTNIWKNWEKKNKTENEHQLLVVSNDLLKVIILLLGLRQRPKVKTSRINSREHATVQHESFVTGRIKCTFNIFVAWHSFVQY